MVSRSPARCCSLVSLRRLRFSRRLNRWWCLRRCRLNRGFGLRFGAAGSVGTSCFGLFLLPGGLPRRFGSGARRVRSAPSFLIIRGQDITQTTKTTREAGRRCRPGRSGGSACASGCFRAPEGHEVLVSTMVPTPLFSVILERMSSQVAQRSAGVGQLGAAQVDLVVQTQKPAARRRRSLGPACGPR